MTTTPDNKPALLALEKMRKAGISSEEIQQVAWLYERVNGSVGANKWKEREEFKGTAQNKIMLVVLSKPALLDEALGQSAEYYKKQAVNKGLTSAAKAFAKLVVDGVPCDFTMYPAEFQEQVKEQVKKLQLAA